MHPDTSELGQSPSSRTACGVLIDPLPRGGEENMHIDEALLEAGCRSTKSLVRVYSWQHPTVTLGFFQKNDSLSPLFRDLSVVRRLTGGGAILHDREVTYSCVVPGNHPVCRNPTDLYTAMHQKIVDLLEICGARAHIRGIETGPVDFRSTKDESAPPNDPFLCFLRRDRNDIVEGALDESDIRIQKDFRKLVGSAQRRRRGTILQHGSIVLETSEFAPNIAGIRSIFPSFQAQNFIQQLPWRLASVLGNAIPLSSTEDALSWLAAPET